VGGGRTEWGGKGSGLPLAGEGSFRGGDLCGRRGEDFRGKDGEKTVRFGILGRRKKREQGKGGVEPKVPAGIQPTKKGRHPGKGVGKSEPF